MEVSRLERPEGSIYKIGAGVCLPPGGSMPGVISAVKARFFRFRREVLVVAYALFDRTTPVRIRLASLAVLIYLLSPFDLLPEFLPLLGILDDLAIVPWSVALIVRNLPDPQRERAELRVQRLLDRYVSRPIVFIAILFGGLVALWGLAIWIALRWLG